MENIVDFDEVKKIHFVGIGGISMSALALLSVSYNKVCSGSDCVKFNADKLKRQGIKVYFSHKGSNVSGCDLVVYSSAIACNNPEIIYAKNKGILLLERSEFLGLISKKYEKVIAISGSHGKTTTTAMIATTFLRLGLNPTIHIGGEMNLIDGNIKVGNKEFFVTEACEFRDSFLKLFPKISVITNVEKEHLDYFKSFSNEKKSFQQFVNQTSDVCFVNYTYSKYFTSSQIVTFGFDKRADCFADNIKLEKNGCYSFNCIFKGINLGKIKLGVCGKYNILNALACFCVCNYFGLSFGDVSNSLNKFSNVKRRFEFLGTYKGAKVVHDYAHHPTEIKNAIQTCKEVYNLPIVCVFQPHTYSRTKNLIKEFMSCFLECEKVVLMVTYSAREPYDKLGSAEFLKGKLENLQKFSVDGTYDLKSIKTYIRQGNFENKVLLFVGAGDIVKVARNIN